MTQSIMPQFIFNFLQIQHHKLTLIDQHVKDLYLLANGNIPNKKIDVSSSIKAIELVSDDLAGDFDDLSSRIVCDLDDVQAERRCYDFIKTRQISLKSMLLHLEPLKAMGDTQKATHIPYLDNISGLLKNLDTTPC